MKKFPVVFDLETKYSFREYDEPKNLGVSVAAVYDYGSLKGRVFLEEELNHLFKILENASCIVGFNINNFDLPVLQAYYPGKISYFSTLDILEDIKNKIGKRLALNDVVYATLGKRKSGHGLMAIDYYKEGKIEELKKYCLDDVFLTKELFDYGIEYGEIYYLDEKGKQTIKVSWLKYLKDAGNSSTPMTLPF